MVSHCNVRGRFNTDEETWPPDQQKKFTPLVLTHHQHRHTMKQAIALAKLDDIKKITLLTSTQALPKCNQR